MNMKAIIAIEPKTLLRKKKKKKKKRLVEMS